MLDACVCKNCRRMIGRFSEAGPFIHIDTLSVDCFKPPEAEPSIWMTEEEEALLHGFQRDD